MSYTSCQTLMTKEFTIPPVIFPSGEASTTINVPGGNNLHRRRWPPTAPFQPPQPTTSSIPFTSFDLGPTSIFAPLHGNSTFSDEPSLLEELEIDADLIYRKTLSLLNPFRLNPSIHDSADLSGPFLYYITFCLFQMFAGKVQFGVVLGCIVVFSTFLYIIFNMLEGKNGNLDLYRCFSLVGYSMLPEVVFSAVSLLIPRGGAFNFGLAVVVVMWSTGICARLLAEGGSGDNTHRGLIAYPCLLIYAVFSMLVIF
ncbi:protein YIPF5 homolog [Impatiens glandulifera]|uniref:protein YIPF5 homolog n=1 Tax=Impatiens glandulifera TaxID=253017 RepID=UPI001FB054A6|nr:protein YIPF5 homolog [Impatiens glandulifera]